MTPKEQKLIEKLKELIKVLKHFIYRHYNLFPEKDADDKATSDKIESLESEITTLESDLSALEQETKRESEKKLVDSIYDKIREDLKHVKLQTWRDNDGGSYPLLDLLSEGNNVKIGLEEIDNIVEQIEIEDLIKSCVPQSPELREEKERTEFERMLEVYRDDSHFQGMKEVIFTKRDCLSAFDDYLNSKSEK